MKPLPLRDIEVCVGATVQVYGRVIIEVPGDMPWPVQRAYIRDQLRHRCHDVRFDMSDASEPEDFRIMYASESVNADEAAAAESYEELGWLEGDDL